MSEPYLEVTFRHGKAVAAYLYLRRDDGQKSVRTERQDAGILVDYSDDGRPIGLELTAPSLATAAIVNGVLQRIGAPTLEPQDLAPLAAA